MRPSERSTEDLDFKPLTEGLGFHRKKGEVKADGKFSSLMTQERDLKNSERRGQEPLLKSPLPRKEDATRQTGQSSSPGTQPKGVPSPDVIDELVRSFQRPKETFIEDKKTPQVIIKPVSPQTTEERPPLPWMLSPFFVDAMLVVALFLSCLLATLLITEADLLAVILKSSSDWEFWMTFPLMGGGMLFIYMTLSRILLGASLGEIVFDVQLGTQEQRCSLKYSFQVLWRSFLALATGVILLPLLSLMFRKDFLGTWSGLRLYRRETKA